MKNETSGNNILSNSVRPMNKAFNMTSFGEMTKGVDLGELEKQNRLKFGVKKPANIWRHEMDDSRITADQLRTTNFKTTMFDCL